MKTFYLFFPLLFLSLNLFSQDISEQRYKSDLQSAETLQDTIVAWHTYRITTDQDSTSGSMLLDETLKNNYPIWTDIEKTRLVNGQLLTEESLEEFVAKSDQLALQKYAHTLLRMKQIALGKIKTSDNKMLLNELNSPKDIVYNYFLKAKQHNALGHVDSIKFCLEKVTEGVNEDIYSGLQLGILSEALNYPLIRNCDEGITYFSRAFRISEALSEYNQRFRIYNCQAMKLKAKRDLDGSMKSVMKTVEIAEKIGKKSNIVISNLNLATFFHEQGRFEEGYEYIYKAREMAETMNHKGYLNKTYSAEAFAKMNEKKYGEAKNLLKFSSENLDEDETINNKALVLVNLIDCYYSTSKLDSAYIYYQKLEEVDPNNSTGYLSYVKSFISQYIVESGDHKLAQQYINIAYDDAVAYNDLRAKSMVLLAQARLDEAKGNLKSAIKNYKEHHNIENDFRNEDQASEVTKVKLNMEYQKEKEIVALSAEKERLQITSERNQALFLGGLALLAALSSLGFYLFVRRKNKLINNQNEKLENLNRTKDTLFQIIGHDLKKPTINFRNVSKNISYLLEKQDYKRLQLLGEEVDQDAKSLYNLTDNLLNWALMQKDTISIKPENVNVHEIVNYNFDLFSTLSKRKGITLENLIDKDLYVLVDRNSLDTIIRNLIDNAIKYTPQDGLISLTCKVTDGLARISITDTGIGMTQAEIDAINYDQSIDSKKGTDGEKGSGIGLRLIKNLIKKNQGKLEILSKKGNGSTIFVDLPLAG